MRQSHTSPTSVDLGLTVLRSVIGLIAVAHGGQKLFVYGTAGVTGAFTQMGVPMAELMGPATGVIELLGGIALMLGLFTRTAGVGLAFTMLGAIGYVHMAGGFFAPNGIEFPLALLGAHTTLIITGAGRYSLDALIAARRTPDVEAVPMLRELRQAA